MECEKILRFQKYHRGNWSLRGDGPDRQSEDGWRRLLVQLIARQAKTKTHFPGVNIHWVLGQGAFYERGRY